MTIPRTPATIGVLGDDVRTFALTLRAEGKKPKTVRTYCESACWLAQRLDLDKERNTSSFKITSWSQVTKRHIRLHMAWLSDNYSPAYCSNQYRALQAWFRWISDEDGIPNPMAGMTPPSVPQKLVPVLADGELKKLLGTCGGESGTRSFNNLRDKAIILMFASSGARLAEVAGLRVSDIDLEKQAAIVTGKGSKMRIVRYSPEAAVALSRYLKVRAKFRNSETLWLGQRGPLLPNGIYQMIERRARKAGIRVYPHMFRHNFSHRWLVNGGNEGDLMQLAGWNSASMVSRYGASAAAERARNNYDKIMSA